MPIRINPKFMRNMARSLGSATVSAFGDVMPTVKSNAESNKTYVAETYATSKEKMNDNDIKNTYIYRSGRDLINNAIKDLKSGNLYNNDRLKQAENQSFKDMGFDFDNFNFDNDSNGNMFASDETKDNDTNTINQQNIVITNDTGLSDTFNGGINKLAKISTTTMKVNHFNSSTISRQMSRMLEFQHENTTKFYNDMSDKLADMQQNISQMTGFLSVMSEVSVGGLKREYRQSMMTDLLGVQGLDLRGMGELYKNKFGLNKSNMDDHKSLFNMFIKPELDKFIANPLGTGMKYGIKALMPKAFKSALGEFDQLVKFFPTMMQGKLQSWKDDGNIFKRLASKIFGLDLKGNKNLDFSNYEKGKVSFDGITRRSIVNVIPSLLSKILASVSKNSTHKEELVYDYENGKFTTRKRVLKGMNEDLRNFSVDSYDIKKYKEQIFNENSGKFNSEKEMTAFMKKVDSALLEMVKNSKLLTANTKLEDISKDNNVAQAILNNFNGQTNSGKAKYQHDILTASNAYNDVYRRIEDSESFHNVFDIDKKLKNPKAETNTEMVKRLREFQENSLKDLDPNNPINKMMQKLLYNVDGGKYDVENDLNPKNPLYWVTKTIRKGNTTLADFFFGKDGEKPTIEPKNPQSPDGDDKPFGGATMKQRGKKFTRFASSVVRKFNPNSNINASSPFERNSEPDEEPEVFKGNNSSNREEKTSKGEGTFRKLFNSIFKLNRTIDNNNKILTGEKESTSESKNNSSIFSQENMDNLSYLPKINDNLLHIIKLTEAKLSGDGLPVDRIGKFKNTISGYKDKTLGFFDKIFLKGKGNVKGGGVLSRVNDRVRTFFGNVFGGNKGDKSGGGFFSGIFGRIKGGEGKRSLVGNLIGKKGIITTFISDTFKTVTDLVKQNAPRVKETTKNITGTLIDFTKKSFETVLGLGKKGLEKGSGLLGRLGSRGGDKSTKGNGIFGILSGLLGTAGGFGSKLLGAGASGLGKLKGMLFNRDGGGESSGGNKIKFSIPNIFDKIFNKERESIHVIVSGGHLDSIKDVVRVREHIGDENSAEEQINKFGKRKSDRQAFKKPKKEKRQNPLDPNSNSGGGIGGFLSNMLSNIVSESIAERFFGGGRDMGGRGNRNGGQGRRGMRQRLQESRLGQSRMGQRMFGGGANVPTPNGGAPRQGVLSRMKGKMGSMFGRGGASATGAMAGGVSRVAGKGLLKGALKFVPGIGLAVAAGSGLYSAVDGFSHANEMFNTYNATMGQKLSAGAGGLLSDLSFGLLDEKSMAQGIHSIGSTIADNPIMSALGLGAGGLMAKKGYDAFKNRGANAPTPNSTANPNKPSLMSRMKDGAMSLGGKAKDGLSALKGKFSSPTPAVNPATASAGGGMMSKLAGGAGGMLKKGGSLLAKGARFIPGVGLAVTAGSGLLGAVNGANSANEIFKTEKATLGQKMSAGTGGLLSALSFGMINKESAAQGLHSMGSRVKDFLGFGKKKEGEGENSSNPIVKMSSWVEKLGKFLTVGPIGSFFTGIIGALTGSTLGGIAGKIGGFFKGMFDKIFGGGDDKDGGGGDTKIGDGIGALSQKYESSGDPGAVSSGAGDHGGQSFGMYQFSRNMGSLKGFIGSLGASGHADWQKQLEDAYNDPSKTASVWKQIAQQNPEEFGKAQEAYIVDSYYKPAAQGIRSATGVDIGKRPSAVQAMLLSTAVQHGSGGAIKVFKTAIGNKGDSISDTALINAVYDERGANGGMKWFSSSSSKVRASVVKRFQRERKDALAMLEKGGGDSKTKADANENNGGTSEAKGKDRSEFYQNPFDTATGVGGVSGGDSRFEAKPSGSYSSIGAFEKLYGGGGTALAGGSTYVADMLSTPDQDIEDLRWKVGSSNISMMNAYSARTQRDLTSMIPTPKLTQLSSQAVSSNFNSLSSDKNSAKILKTMNNEQAEVTNKALSNMTKNAEEIANIQSILKQINDSTKQNNDTLTKMLRVMIDIRENSKKSGNPVTMPVTGSRSASSSATSSSSNPISNELQQLLSGY